MKNQSVQEFLKKVKPSDDLFFSFYNAVNGSKNKLIHNVVSEALTVDDTWITTIESSLFFIEDIIKNPKKFIIDDDIIVEVERARRTTSKTIRHLASNSRDVSRIDDDGFVMPKRVLTTQIDEDLAIYENRFVCTLVQRVISFVENQRELLKNKLNTSDITNIEMHSDFSFGEAKFDYLLKLSVKEPPSNKVLLEKNTELIARINALSNRLQIIKNTEFVKKLSVLKPIQPPIQKTNIIKMNVNYRNCYKLWLYISAYTTVGFSVEVMDKNLPIDGGFYDDMTVLAALSVKTLMENEKIRREIYKRGEFKNYKKKDYVLKDNVSYSPVFIGGEADAGDEVINEFYFNEMKRVLQDAVEGKRKNTVVTEKQLTMNFNKFYRSLEKVNDAIIADVIKDEPSPKIKIKRTPVQVRQEEYDRQQKVLRRYKRLSKLKSDSLEKALRAESREYIKLDKLKAELEEAKGRARDKRLAAQKRKEKLQKIKEKSNVPKQSGQEYLDKLREEEEAKLLAAEEKRRERREQAVRRRELKTLERLREKYKDYEG